MCGCVGNNSTPFICKATHSSHKDIASSSTKHALPGERRENLKPTFNSNDITVQCRAGKLIWFNQKKIFKFGWVEKGFVSTAL